MTERVIEILERQREDLVARMLRKHEEVQEAQGFTERILSGITELFLLLDQDQRVIQGNQEFQARTGYGDLEQTPVGLSTLVGADEADRIAQAFRAGEFRDLEVTLNTATGGQLPVKMRGATHVTPNGRVLNMLICTDLSEFSELMARMQEAQRQLIHSARLASLGEMTAGIGHELTQPLNAILLFARNSLKALDSPTDHRDMLRANLQTIIDRVGKATSIISTMRSFGRRVEGELYPVELGGLIRKILGFLGAQFRLAEVQVELALATEPVRVLGVEVRLEQVFINLIQNAIQAMGQEERPFLRIGFGVGPRLNPKTMQETPHALIVIEDNGEGMDEEVQKRIFDPFFTTREVGTGMGLGLAIVERIVRGFSGFIEVWSRKGQGSRFTVVIPLAEVQER